MQVTVLKEEGHDLALRGMAYSFKDRAEDPDAWWKVKKQRAYQRAPILAPMDGGHNKFLRQIIIWIDIEAPRSFWSEFDTYKVGTVAQSESTMHTLSKRPPTYDDFELGTTQATMNCFINQWVELKSDITKLKENLPEGYLQRRLVTMNYETVRNIHKQREDHRYIRWQAFLSQLLPKLTCQEYLLS